MQLSLLLLIELYTLFQLWLISAPKKVGWKCIILYLAIGTIGVTAITLTIHLFTTQIIPPEINSYTANPLIEEAITILPILLIARFTLLKEKLDVLDWMLLGAAVGCGFQIMETGIRIIGAAQEWPFFHVEWIDIGKILTTWLPERIEDKNIGYAGHGITAALMGLGVGLWNKHKRWGWVVFLATFFWCFFDHSLSNYTLGSWVSQKKLAKFLWGITSKGKSMPWILGITVIGISFHNIYRSKTHHQIFEKCKTIIVFTTNRI